MPNFSGKWNLQSQMRGVKSETWTGFPVNVFYIWGDSADGRLGDNQTTVNRSSPTQLGFKLKDDDLFIDIGMGTDFTHGVRLNNTLWGWGRNDFGQLGDSSDTYRSSPVQVGALTNWETVTGGDQHAFAIKTDGTMWGWGHNNNGAVGDPTQNLGGNVRSPVQIGTLTTWSHVSAGGDDNGSAIASDGTLWTWGDGASGRLGLTDNAISRSSPTQVGAETDWAKVSFGQNHVLATTTSGELYVWGEGGVGQTGLNSVTDVSSPTQLGADTDWSEIAAGGNYSAAIKTNGTLWVWGNGQTGVLGQNNTQSTSSPVQVGALTNWSKVAVQNFSATNDNKCLALKTDGTLWIWGGGDDGSLGLNEAYGGASTLGRSSPVQIGTNTDWSYVKELGNEHSSAISTERTGTPRTT